MLDQNEWALPLTVMAIAAVGGAVATFMLRRDDRQANAIGASGRHEDLMRRQAEALEALAALETQRGHMAPDDYEAERKALLQKGATAMRKLDEEAGPTPGAAPSGVDPISAGVAELTAALKRGELDELTYARAVAALASARPAMASAAAPPPGAAPAAVASPGATTTAPPVVSPVWQGAIYALAGAGLIAGLLWFANNQSQPRRDGASMTGNQDLGTVDNAGNDIDMSQEPPIFKQRREAAEAAFAKDPNDVKALNELTQLAFREPQKAWNYNEMARKVDPKDPDARMYHAVITAMMGMPEKAEERFEELLTEIPDHGPAWAWRGLVQLEAKQWEKAEASLLKAKELGITDHSLENSLKMAQAKGVMPGAGAIPDGANPPPPAGNTATIAAGVIELDPGRTTFAGKTLFVSVKDPAMPGPPVAALQLPPGPFPMPFSITEANKMAMGGDRPIPANVQLTIRLDDDGNAMTKSPSDPQVTVDNLARGTTGLSLTLK